MPIPEGFRRRRAQLEIVKVLRRLLSYLKPHRFHVLLVVVCMLAQTGLDLLSPQLVKHTIDMFFSPGRGYQPGMETSLLLWASAIVAASLGRGLFLFGQNYVAEFTSHQVVYN